MPTTVGVEIGNLENKKIIYQRARIELDISQQM